MRHPRHPTALRCISLVLGLLPLQPVDEWQKLVLFIHLWTFNDCHHHATRDPYVGDCYHSLPRPTEFLSFKTRQGAVLLLLRRQAKSRALVRRHGRLPELLALSALQQKLVLPVVVSTCSTLGRRLAPAALLRRSLGGLPLDLGYLVQATFLDHPDLRHRSRRTPLVSDVVGHKHDRRIHPRRQPDDRGIAGSVPMVVAWRPRRPPRSGLRYDPAADLDEVPHRLRPDVRSDPRCSDHDRRTRVLAEQAWSRRRLSKFWPRLAGGVAGRVVLGCVALSARHLCWVFQVSLFLIFGSAVEGLAC